MASAADDNYVQGLFADDIAAEEAAEKESGDGVDLQEKQGAEAEAGEQSEPQPEAEQRAEAAEEEVQPEPRVDEPAAGDDGRDGDGVGAPAAEPTIEELQAKIAELEKQSEGRLRDLRDWRSKAKEWQALQPAQAPGTHAAGGAQPAAPAPSQDAGTPAAGAPASEAPPGMRVEVSPDGKHVYVPEEEARRLLEQQNQPSPEEQAVLQYAQAKASAYQQFQFSHMEDGREQAEEAIRNVTEADTWLANQVAMIQQSGVQLTANQLPQALQHFGVFDELGRQYPDVAPFMQELMGAWSTRNPMWEQSILERIYSRKSDRAKGESAPLKSVENTPVSMARKGGSRSDSPRTDEAEFEKLDASYKEDPLSLDSKQFKRWRELMIKLEKPGWQSV
jgi:hypothetical protein